MELSQMGEFALIKHLTKDFNCRVPSTRIGVGDDAAVLISDPSYETVVTTDLLLEGIHFDLVYAPLKHLGFKAISVNVSDVCAMNAIPEQMLVSIGCSSRFQVEDLNALYEGIYAACEYYGVDLVGGDTSASMTGLTISVTAIGRVEKDQAVLRSGAKPRDLICLTGNVGAAFMGLKLLEREKFAHDGTPDFKPRFEGRDYILQRQLHPYARLDVVQRLREKGVSPTSMIDVSDGLASELIHLSQSSGVGCRVFEREIPIDHETAMMAEELNFSVLTAALNGGEDYELLFTAPLGVKDLVEQIEDVHLIGYVTDRDEPSLLVTPDGHEIPLQAQGFQAFRPTEKDEE